MTRSDIQALLDLISNATADASAVYETSGGLPSLNQPHPLDEKDDLNLRKIIRILEGACEQLCSTLAPPRHTASNRSSSVEAACMGVAVEGHVADVLKGHPEGLSIVALAEKTGMNAIKLSHVMRLLTTRNCFQEVSEDVFANNRISLTLAEEDPVSSTIGHWTDECMKLGSSYLFESMIDPEFANSFDPSKSAFMYSLKDTLKPGTALFDWLPTQTHRHERFGRAMTGGSLITGSRFVIDVYPWADLPTGTQVCDVGGGIGTVSIELTKKYPHLQVTIQDLATTLEDAKKLFNAQYPQAVRDKKIDFAAKSFFDGSVEGQDIYYLRHVLHDWPDDQAILILQNIRKAMKPNSKVLVHDIILQRSIRSSDVSTSVAEAPKPLLPNYGSGSIRKYTVDNLMLMLANAKERMIDEFKTLGNKSGLKLVKVYDLVDTGILEFEAAE